MKKFLKLIKSPNILWISGIILFFLILRLLYPEKDKIIQSELVLILIIITLFYAVQTQKLVEQEKKNIEEEKNRQIAMFAEKNLQQFYIPFSFKLVQLKNKVEKLSWQNFRIESNKVDDFFAKEIIKSIVHYAYLALKETTGLAATIDMFFNDIKELKENEEEKFYLVKQDFLKTISTVMYGIQKKLLGRLEEINKAYSIYEPSDFDAAREIMTLHHKAVKKID